MDLTYWLVLVIVTEIMVKWLVIPGIVTAGLGYVGYRVYKSKSIPLNKGDNVC